MSSLVELAVDVSSLSAGLATRLYGGVRGVPLGALYDSFVGSWRMAPSFGVPKITLAEYDASRILASLADGSRDCAVSFSLTSGDPFGWSGSGFGPQPPFYCWEVSLVGVGKGIAFKVY